MQIIEDTKMRGRNMLIPVFLCLLISICSFGFLEYIIMKNRQEMEQTALAGESFSVILDQEGNVVQGNEPALGYGKFGFSDAKEKEMVLDAMKEKRYISFVTENLDKMQQRAVLVPLNVNDWYILTIYPEFWLQTRYLDNAIGIGIIILLSSGLLFFYFILQYKLMLRKQEEILGLAYTDSLTGCRNFSSFKQEADQILRTKDITSYALWYCDINKFKFINDVLGYEEGDRILNEIANLFREYGGQDALFCKISADNFAGFYKYKSISEIRSWFDKLVDVSQNRVLSSNGKITVELCMGVYCLEEVDRELSIEQIVNRANIAQKYVKKHRDIQFGFYNKEIRDREVYESELELEIDRAMREREFKLFIQPKVCLQNGNQIVGGEILVRWDNPRKGIISPGLFIPLLEQNGKIVNFDRYIFEVACQWYKKFLQSGGDPINMAINVSKIGMLREDFVDFYGWIKDKYELPDNRLELEFTESVMLNDDTLFTNLVTSLHHKGFVCSLDDFGSGYSSLNLLKNLPIDVLKLDIAFFRKSSDLSRARIVISNVVNMAKELCIRTIAEGVEKKEMVDFLKSAGCDVVQGYVFAKPMPIEAFEKMMMNKKGQGLIPADFYE